MYLSASIYIAIFIPIDYGEDKCHFGLLGIFLADKNTNFPCKKVQLKSEASGNYLQAVGFHIDAQGHETTTNSTFVVSKINGNTIALKTHDSRMIISRSPTEYTLVDIADDTILYNTQFIVKELNEKRISLQSDDLFYLSSDSNGFISQTMNSPDALLTPSEIWTFNCFEGKSDGYT